jgi:hypothetical protein
MTELMVLLEQQGPRVRQEPMELTDLRVQPAIPVRRVLQVTTELRERQELRVLQEPMAQTDQQVQPGRQAMTELMDLRVQPATLVRRVLRVTTELTVLLELQVFQA